MGEVTANAFRINIVMNNNSYHTEQYKRLQAQKVDRKFGPILKHKKVCARCKDEFIYEGRQKTKAFERAKFCSRGCSNDRTDQWKGRATRYRTICFHHHEHKCIVCGFEKIIDVHHADENKKNNDPSNLVPLCPNHHEMVHSKWKDEVLPHIKKYVKKFKGAVA